jgi:hypothetical protein
MVKSLTTQIFIERAKKTHNNEYDYSKVDYKSYGEKVCIVCTKHGEFWQTPANHLKGQGCPKCKFEKLSLSRKYSKEDIIDKAKTIYGDLYDYSNVEIRGDKISLVCKKHGLFSQTIGHFLEGHGCQKCGREKAHKKTTLTTQIFIEKAKEIHGDKYDYSKVNYINNRTKVCIICPKHGSFWQMPYSHLIGKGCKKCSIEESAKNLSFSKNEFIKRAKEVHGDKYDYSKVNYINSKTPITIICPEHGEFTQIPSDHLTGYGCPHCGHHISKWEEEICNFLKENETNIIQSDKKILEGKEIDILLPDYNIGIECDGLRWHSEEFNKDKNYHLLKTEECAKKGIRLIHIFEDEWKTKPDIVKSMLLNLLQKHSIKIYARKCKAKEINFNEAQEFLLKNHIQGKTNGLVNLGLFYDNELVSLMVFGKPRIYMGGKNTEDNWELVRFCSKLNVNVIGGASKLLKEFIEKYSPNNITTYADKRWSLGNLYNKLGFIYDHDSAPNYYYIIGHHRENRFKYRKSELVKEGYNKDLSEHQIMLNRGIYRIYDCGCKVYKLNLNKKGES